MEIWRYCKVGKSHKLRHMGCQDYVMTKASTGQTVLALSDGHSCAIRAGMSSRIACRAFLSAIESGCAVAELPAVVKDSYDRLVVKYTALHAVTDWEQQQLQADPTRTLYGATLLGAVLEPNRTILFQLGDGSLSALKEDGTLFPALPEDTDCMMSFTSSICYPREQAIAHSRCVVYPTTALSVVLSSDGYDFTGSQPWAVLSQLQAPQEIAEKLPVVLDKGTNGDDQSLVIAYNVEKLLCDEVQQTLTQTLQRGILEAKRKKLLREKNELASYLKFAVKHCRELQSASRKKELLAFMKVIYPRKERFEVVLAQLDEIKQQLGE